MTVCNINFYSNTSNKMSSASWNDIKNETAPVNLNDASGALSGISAYWLGDNSFEVNSNSSQRTFSGDASWVIEPSYYDALGFISEKILRLEGLDDNLRYTVELVPFLSVAGDRIVEASVDGVSWSQGNGNPLGVPNTTEVIRIVDVSPSSSLIDLRMRSYNSSNVYVIAARVIEQPSTERFIATESEYELGSTLSSNATNFTTDVGALPDIGATLTDSNSNVLQLTETVTRTDAATFSFTAPLPALPIAPTSATVTAQGLLLGQVTLSVNDGANPVTTTLNITPPTGHTVSTLATGFDATVFNLLPVNERPAAGWQAIMLDTDGSISSTGVVEILRDADSIPFWLIDLTGMMYAHSASTTQLIEYGATPPADTTPDQFTFTDTTATVSTVATSNTITVSGINAATGMTIGNGEYSLNGGAFTSASTQVNNGDTVQVRGTAPSTAGATLDVVLSIGTISDTFTITAEAATPNPDTTPDAFTFTDNNGYVGTSVRSNSLSITGIDAPTPISVVGGEYSIDGGSYTSASGTITNGQVVRLQGMAPNVAGQASAVTVTIGGVSDTFTITAIALADDTTPDAFSFTDQTNVALSTVTTSNAITVSGVNTASPISIAGGTYSINSGLYTADAGTVDNGDTVTVRLTSSASYSQPESATLTIGSVSDTFTVTTLADPSAALPYEVFKEIALEGSLAKKVHMGTVEVARNDTLRLMITARDNDENPLTVGSLQVKMLDDTHAVALGDDLFVQAPVNAGSYAVEVVALGGNGGRVLISTMMLKVN
jgi:hypothetical protein